MFEEDADAFLADFGVPCSKGATNFTAEFWRPGELIDVHGVSMISDAYEITYRTTAVTLLSGDAVTVAGNAYVVQAVKAIDDGLFTLATLNK